MIHYNFSQRFAIVLFFISMICTSSYFLQSASAYPIIPRYDGEIIFPPSNEAGGNTNYTAPVIQTQNMTTHIPIKDTTVSVIPRLNTTVSVMLPQNITAYDKTNSTDGFSNIVCKSGYEYVQMTGQYTAGNISYKVIFLQMVAKGSGFVDNIDAHKTKSFNAIARYSSTFSSCIVQIDGTIPK